MEEQMQSPDIWSDKDKSSKLGGQIKDLKEENHKLKTKLEQLLSVVKKHD